jgi:hypothetical protein
LKTKIKVLNANNVAGNQKNDNNTNNNSNMSMAFKSKANSSLYTSSKDDNIDYNNKYKFDEFYTLFKENHNQNYENALNKNRTMSNIKPSRNNNNYFQIVNRQMNKKNNMSQQNTIININSYLQKNYSTHNLRKNNSSNNRKNYNNSRKKKQNYKLNSHNSSSFNITNNTYNMNKNNIMINLNPKNANMNIEKLKVQKKLHEYQRLIDQKLNELIRNKHPHTKNNKYILNIRNSSPNIYINSFHNAQKKYNYNQSELGINYYFRKNQKKNLATNINTKNLNYKKLLSKSTIDSGKRNKIEKKSGSKNTNFLKNKNNSEYISNMKRNINKQSFSSKVDDSNSKKDEESIINKGKINLSLRKFIFAKCSNPTANTINNFH